MIPIVISGGTGTRLWPVSRTDFPKQFCHLLDESLQHKTLKRLTVLGSPWTLTVQPLEALTKRVHRDLNIPEEQLILEPFGKNTAPAIALACHVFSQKGLTDEIVGVFPADHLVQQESAFVEAVKLAAVCAKEGRIVTLGIQPDYAAAGFGYIKTTDDIFKRKGALRALKVAGFFEKPSEDTAKQFIQAGRYFWNSGMFIFQIKVMIDELKRYTPELWQKIRTVQEGLSNIEEVYESLTAGSIDYAVMEKLNQLICIPSDIGWSDVGSWEEMARIGTTATKSAVRETDAENNYVFSEKEKVFALIGVDDLLVVDTPDACLISRRGRSQDVRYIVKGLEQEGFSQGKDAWLCYRPWGKYEILSDGEDFKSKIITLDPGQRLSYQSHDKRAEHWIIVSGLGKVTLNNDVIPVKAGDHIFIPKKAKHRIGSDPNTPLKFVEIQLGDYFGEDDITRYDDDYNRAEHLRAKRK